MASSNFVVKYSEYRPCLVNGVKALFHRFTDRHVPIVKHNAILHPDIKDSYERLVLGRLTDKKPIVFDGIVDVGFTQTIAALVEFEDGTVKEVEPESIRFLDSDGIFSEFAFNAELDKEKTNDQSR